MTCFRGQLRPIPRGRGPSAPQFWGSSYIYAYTLWRRTTRFDVVTHVGEGRVSWGQPRLQSQESGVPGLPNFGVLLYLCPHPLTRNDQIRRGNTYGEGSCFHGSATFPSQSGGVPAQPTLRVLLCLWLYCLKKNDHIGRGNTHGVGACF